MKTVLLLAISTIAMAVDAVFPGMNVHAAPFTDLRLQMSTSVPITTAEAAGVGYEAKQTFAPHLGLQLVHGVGDESLGVALGLEIACDDHRGRIVAIGGSKVEPGTGHVELRAATLGLLPKLVLRPSYGDPLEWGPGSVQLEIGPVVAAGVGQAWINGSDPSDSTLVLRWGTRFDLLWTANSRWQGGLSLAWESVTASPSPDKQGKASISGEGFCGGLIFGRRM
jgi:hypothetical protein